MRVTIDKNLCSGHGRCWTLAPEVFTSDADGYGTVPNEEIGPELEARARIGQQNCPERAISLSD